MVGGEGDEGEIWIVNVPVVAALTGKEQPVYECLYLKNYIY
jgi:hypothetical protein